MKKKTVAILYELELNKLRGTLIYKQPGDKEKTSHSDIEKLSGPNRLDSEEVAEETCTLPTSTVSSNPHDLVDEIVGYIISIDDAK